MSPVGYNEIQHFRQKGRKLEGMGGRGEFLGEDGERDRKGGGEGHMSFQRAMCRAALPGTDGAGFHGD